MKSRQRETSKGSGLASSSKRVPAYGEDGNVGFDDLAFHVIEVGDIESIFGAAFLDLAGRLDIGVVETIIVV